MFNEEIWTHPFGLIILRTKPIENAWKSPMMPIDDHNYLTRDKTSDVLMEDALPWGGKDLEISMCSLSP